MRSGKKITGLLILVMMILSSCNTLKYVSEKDPLYTGPDIKIKTVKHVPKKVVKRELEKRLSPKPNGSILGFRSELWFYNMGKDKKKGLKKWLAKKLGKPPVLLSQVDPARSSEIMQSYLDSKGFFRSKVNYEVKKKKKLAKVIYSVYLPKPYLINNYDLPAGEDSLSMAIRAVTEKKNLLRRDKQYDLDLLKQERLRIDAELKKKGYYFFNAEYLIFQADTTAGDKHVNFALNVKKDIPDKARIVYYIGNVYLVPSYSLTPDSLRKTYDTVFTGGVFYLDDGVFRQGAIVRNVFLKPGDRYNRDSYNLTIKRMMGMGVFSFASIKFSDTLTEEGKGILETRILLTRRAAKSLMAEPDIVTKSNNYSGPALNLRFKNRNFLRGSEQLSLNVDGNYEFQLSGSQKGFNSYEFGGTIQLLYPHFILPFRIDDSKSFYIPKTKFEAGIRFIHRVQLFDMANLTFKFGYIWRTSDKDEFEVNPVYLNFSKLLKRTEKFNELLRANPYLQRSFEEQFTIGSMISYTHNGLVGNDRKNQYYLNTSLDFSGNILSVLQSLTKSYKNTAENPYKLFGYKYSQYTRAMIDGRYYLTFDRNNRIATRLITGAGIPYGNSKVMPYLKQFFSGGSNSIRAFLPRTVGPGSYIPPDSILQNSYYDQSGDIKLEYNLEYRFTIISVLKGAIFFDAGNVWLMRADTNFRGGEFQPDRFYKEIAVGTGLGLRVDLSFFVIRLDVGMPLRKPNLPEGQRWVTNQINFGSPKWRRDNLILNIAIGYPF
ncbi:MAG: BamA/TamA family outer membrane protein [Syntrophothermus sp.]